MNKFHYCLQLSFMIIISISPISCSTGYNKHADQYYEEGLLFYEQMEYDRSVESFNKVLELAPYGKDNNIVYYNRGMAHLKNRQYDKSIYEQQDPRSHAVEIPRLNRRILPEPYRFHFLYRVLRKMA